MAFGHVSHPVYLIWKTTKELFGSESQLSEPCKGMSEGSAMHCIRLVLKGLSAGLCALAAIRVAWNDYVGIVEVENVNY
jgi:hypothetical protein